MTDGPDQPTRSYGQLEHGVTVEDLQQAIARSGYPFQAVVAETVQSTLDHSDGFQFPQLQEEWAYIDQESGEARAIDIFAEVSLTKSKRNSARSGLSILIECKQSALPFVFFLRADPPTQIYTFPEIAGLRSSGIALFKRDENGEYRISSAMSVHDAFDTAEIDFCGVPCPYAISISRAARSGSKLELTGEDAYRSITLPLMKAADYVRLKTNTPKAEAPPMWRFILCLAVIRAPMYGAYYRDGQSHLLPVPWVRAFRLEPDRLDQSRRGLHSRVRYFDVVHDTYLVEYLTGALSAIRELGSRMASKSEVVMSGRALSTTGHTYKGMKPIPLQVQLPAAEDVRFWVTRVLSGGSLQVIDDSDSALQRRDADS